jgi:hypothetical protein
LAAEPLDSGNVRNSLDFKCGNFQTKRASCLLSLTHFQHRGRIADVPHDREASRVRDNLAQEFKAFANQFRGQQ